MKTETRNPKSEMVAVLLSKCSPRPSRLCGSSGRPPQSNRRDAIDAEQAWRPTCLALAAVVLLVGCTTTRSISNSGYRDPDAHWRHAPRVNKADPGFDYHGELSEFDVLGITRGSRTSEADIQQALAGAKQVRLKPGCSILLIQSGAAFPDGPMVAALSPHFRVVPFSGVPPISRRTADGQFERADADSFSRSLRLAAARGGCNTILCYWGILESANAKLATKTVSWVPVVNWLVPDESEHMRLRLKLALVDVRIGDWAMLSPAPVDASRLSTSPRRGVADQKLVERLKDEAYAAAATELMQQYGGSPRRAHDSAPLFP
jgi:hypothetical protein